MLRKPQKVQQSVESQKEVKERKSRFQIVKLEERIAPRGPGEHGHCSRGRFCGR